MDAHASQTQEIAFTPAAKEAVRQAAELEGISETAVHNRAVQLYAFIIAMQHDGAQLFMREADGQTRLVKIL